MVVNLKQHLAEQRKFSWIPLTLLFFAIILILAYSYIFPAPQIYQGYIKLIPESERSKPYLSFQLASDKSGPGYMILVKDQKIHSVVQSMLDKKVQVKAITFKNEPADFNKIEIFEIRETR